MNEKLQFILSLSIALPFITGMVRLRVIDPSYYPFIWFLAVGVIMEYLPFYTYKTYGRNPTVVLVNLYALVELLILTWLFYNWSLFKRNKKNFWFVMGSFIAVWFVLTCIAGKPTVSNFTFRVMLSVTTIVFCVTMINKLVVTERGNLLKNSKFLICICLIVFYTFFALTNATQLSFFGAKASSFFMQELQFIPAYSNFITNLVYTLAIIWMPRKKNFINLF
jgi:hypothetical protein